MAPTKDQKVKEDTFVKESFLFKHCKKGAIPSSYTGMHACQRNFGFKFTDFKLSEVKMIHWGVPSGQQGYFVPPEVSAYYRHCFYSLTISFFSSIIIL